MDESSRREERGEETEEAAKAEYVCESCGRSFESEAALEKHVHEVGLTE
jgi:transposase-like protein